MKNSKLSKQFNTTVWTGQYEIQRWPDQALMAPQTAYTQNEFKSLTERFEKKAGKKLFGKSPVLPEDKMAILAGDWGGKASKIAVDMVGTDESGNAALSYYVTGPEASDRDVHQNYVLAIVDRSSGVVVKTGNPKAGK